jgi:hypothetical protein
MAGDPSSPLQKAVIDILENDATLFPKITGVFSNVPDNEDYPYIYYGEAPGNDWGTFTTYGEDILFNLHIYSNYDTNKQTQDIMNDIKRLFCNTDFAIDGWANVGCWFDYSNIMEEKSSIGSIIYHGIVRFKIEVQEL